MLSIHHLDVSQSERIIWLREELGVPSELTRYDRDPVTILAPPELRALHPIGSAPVIADGQVVLAESGAVVGTSSRNTAAAGWRWARRIRSFRRISTPLSCKPTWGVRRTRW
ncbi:MAG TPA: glutathione S-transferase N-terminal domain-containing protein [Acidisphaera sp.]|nr:glutathione S-transferase N-terminal domain-containing protein [Acidisphaera sp.]